MADKNNIISIRDLVYRYDSGPGPGEAQETEAALKGIDLDIAEGEFTAIVGRNGSGKSTLAKCINALFVPSRGDVYVDGMNTRDDDILDIRRTAAMVFQNPDNQIVSAIVEDDVAFGPENLGVDPVEIRRRVDSSLEAVKMGGYKNKAPHLLSGGQKQRIAIAGAVAMDPKCIVFDEPTAMLDPSGRREVMDIIKELHSRGMTILLVTHFMEEAAEADRMLVLDSGRIAMDGRPEEIFARADELGALGLDVPVPVRMAMELEKLGVRLPAGIINEDGLIEALCRYR